MAVWIKEKKYDREIKGILFLISPFVGFIASLKDIKTRSSYVIFFLFFVLFGLSFTVQSGKQGDMTIDAAYYREQFELFQYVSKSEFREGLITYFTFKTGIKDYYFNTVAFYISRITSNYHVMFLVFAIVFSYFCLKTFKMFITEDNFDSSLSCYILTYIFMINQIFNINGVRFWTAAWIAVYTVFQIFKNGKRKYFLLVLLTPFVHVSFWLFVVILFLATLLIKFHRFQIILFIISFFLSEISNELIRQQIDILPPTLANLASIYTDPVRIALKSEGGTGFYWITELFNTLERLYINLLVFLFILDSEDIFRNEKTKLIFPFLLIWMAFCNSTMAIPSLGNRFIQLAYPIIAYIWLVAFKGKKYQKFLYAAPIVFIFSAYTQLNRYTMVLEPYFYISSPIYLVYRYLI